ncbi:MAG TPA: molybdopterin-dependent oxidoreductase [Macromonas sp.]|nr:molybdopterin-dependent oxidoreductase [Macromonas sp.]
MPAATTTLPTPRGAVVLTIEGGIHNRNSSSAAQFDMQMLRELKTYVVTTRTPWYQTAVTFSGPRLKDVLARVGAQGQGLRVRALNDYAVDVPFSDAAAFNPILAWQIDGQPLSVRDKGPLFLIYPFDEHPELKNDIYYGRSIWQIQSITVY